MKIVQKRIRNASFYLKDIEPDEEFSIVLLDINRFTKKLIQLDFSNNMNIGETILPKIVGPITRYNANGKYYPIKNLPKETFYVERNWTWKDWNDDYHSKIVYIPRERYQRQFIFPPSIELSIEKINENIIIKGGMFRNSPENYILIKHCINLFLEIFGECDTINSKNKIFNSHRIIKLNWKVLPKGRYPWDKLEPLINSRISRLSENKRIIISDRYEKINSKNPDFYAFGVGGFNDYTIFGFERKSIFILESNQPGNATYVFEKNWEEFSKLSKKEILDNNFQKARIIHKENWLVELFKYIS